MRLQPSMYSRMMHELARDALEVEDAADVLVVEHRVAAGLLHEQAQVLRVAACRSCLMTIGRWKPAWPTRSSPLQTVPMPPAPSSWRIRYFEGSAMREIPPEGQGRRMAERSWGVKAAKSGRYTRRRCASWASTWATCGSGWPLSDETGTLASGLRDAARRVGPRKDVQAVAALVREHEVAEVVVGLPRRLDGTQGPQAEKVLGFVERLRRVLRIPVATRDERLTSVAAGERLAEAGVRGRARLARLDQVAACLMLQELLDERKARAGGVTA